MEHAKAQHRPKFVANYPNFGKHNLLSLRERMGVHTPLTGRGITIAYIDAGFYMHPDVRDRIKLHVDATTSEIIETKTVTHIDVTSWHGLMVSTVGSGDGKASGGYYQSLAPESDMVLIKVSNPQLQVKEADILRGFRWLIKNHRLYNIRVVNVSVGGDQVSIDPAHPLHVSVAKLVAEGVAVVISSGNHGHQRLVPPASTPQAIIVGGYNDQNSANPDDWVGYHSNYGHAYDGSPKPDLVALAEWIPSPILPETFVEKEARWLGPLIGDPTGKALERLIHRGYRDLKLTRAQITHQNDDLYQELQNRIFAHKLIDQYYQYVDGTSVAAPIVSSAIALLLQANPKLAVNEVRSILAKSARPLSSISPQQQGAGALQVDAAIKLATRK